MKSNDTINEEAIHWIACEKEGLSSVQKIELQKWLNQSTIHQNTFDKVKSTQNMFKYLSKETTQELSQDANRGAKKTKIIEKIKPFAFAAVFLLAIFVGLFKVNEYNSPNFTHLYITNNKILEKEQLPDGSIISLDAKGEIDVNLYSYKREVDFKAGQAMFEIAKDKERPFFIKSGKTQIEVVGTKFEVVKSNDSTSVKVEEGIVRVSHILQNENIKDIILLHKGESILLSDLGKIQYYGKTDIGTIALWRQNLIVFNENTLEETFKQFSKYNDFEVKYSSEDIKSLKITGKFSTEEFDIFLNTVPKIYPLEVTKKNNIIYFSKIK